MLRELPVLSSRFSFSDTNYNYDNTNTNVSSHLCDICSIDLARMAKNNKLNKSVGTLRQAQGEGENDLKKAKA
jgi:hypothetical protein